MTMAELVLQTLSTGGNAWHDPVHGPSRLIQQDDAKMGPKRKQYHCKGNIWSISIVYAFDGFP
jgi:hypothetical protein